MITLVFLSFFSAKANEKCLSFTCDDWVTDKCIHRFDSVIVYTNCTYPGTICPGFNKATDQEVSCIPIKEQPPYQLNCVKYKEKDEKVLEGEFCRPGYMKNLTSSVCVLAPQLYEPCTTKCGIGLVCNNNICIEYFSIPAGKPASNSLACQSGVLINKTCQVPVVTAKDLSVEFQSCTTDGMCVDKEKKEKSKCVCTRNDKPIQICTYHRSDPAVIEAKKATSDGDVHLARLLWYKVMQYPYIDHSNECMSQFSEEHRRLRELEKELAECFSYLFALSGVLMLGII